MRQFLARYAELGRTYSVELDDVLANDEHAVALMTARGERAGKQLTYKTAQVYHFRDGKITELWSYSADQDAADEFWS
jgi:ketosteroid isomerase-like protein